MNGQTFSSDFEAALYIILKSQELTLKSFFEAAMREQKRMAELDWKLALLQDNSLGSRSGQKAVKALFNDAGAEESETASESSSHDAETSSSELDAPRARPARSTAHQQANSHPEPVSTPAANSAIPSVLPPRRGRPPKNPRPLAPLAPPRKLDI